ncbi:autotransporter-associated beta strand repeat-containing protein [Luteolibacter sp. LG18]|uniref:beta strand repeat-containing protein n=1 Tax=Luteolibacter sp. LG18 TaxID=2819286 RepID=UPI002B291DE8|nr:hypothetical protein llg_25730 [Luteolibacter sp. LG18]
MKPKRIAFSLLTTFSLACSLVPAARAANITFTLTPTTGTWSTDTWSTAINTIAAGDIAESNTVASTSTALDTPVTLGQLQTGTTAGAIWSLTGTANTITLNGTGLTSNAFGNAGVAAIVSRNTGGNLTVAPPLSFGATVLDAGTTSTGTLTLSGGLTATAAQTLNIRNNGTGGTTISGPVGATGSAISIANRGTSTGTTVISGALGANVASVTQNSTTSALTLSGANASFVGSVSVVTGTLNTGSTGSLGGTTSLSLNGGTAINATVAGVTSAGNPTIALNGNVTYNGNTLNLGTGAVTLSGLNVGIITNSTNNLTIGGNISGSSSLTKNAQSNGSFTNMGALVLNGTNSYTGGTIIQQGQIQFGSAASIPATGSVLLAPLAVNSVNYEGAAAIFNFGFTQTELNKLSTASVGIAGLGANNASALDFTNYPTVSLGTQGNFTYSGTLTPWSNGTTATYYLGGSGNQAANANSVLTVSSVLGNAGSIATGLTVDPTFAGFGPGSVTLNAVNTYTGATRVNTGTLKLDFAGNAGSNTSNLISSSSALTLANFGTLNVAGKSANTNSQTFAGLTLAGSNSTISATQNSATSLTAAFGVISRTSNGTVTFSSVPTTGGFTTTNALDSSGLLGAWATVGTGTATRYATITGGNIAAYSAGTAAATAALLTDVTGLVNYDLAAGGSLPGTTTLSTIRYTGAAGSTDIGASNLTLNGVLNAGTGAATITSSSTGSVVIGSTRDLVLNSANAAIFINAPIVDNGLGASSVTVTGNSGTQYAVFQKASTYTGGTFINGNVAVQAATGGFGTGTVTFSGGQLNAETNAITIANPLVFTQGTSTTLNPNNQSLTLTGAVTGTGTMFVGDGGSFSSLILSSDMSGFNGTIIFNAGGNNGDNFQMGNTSAANNNLSRTTVIGLNAGTRRWNLGSAPCLQVGALSGSLTLITGGTLQVGALNTDTSFGGGTASNMAYTKVGTGTWTLNGSGGMGNTGVAVNNGVLRVDESSMGTPTNFLTSSGLTFNGGTFQLFGKGSAAQNSSQAFSATTVNPGASTLRVEANGGLGTVATLANINRTTTVGVNGGGTLDFILPSGTQSASNGITTTSTASVLGGIMVQANTNSVAYATVNATDWAALSGNNVVAYTGYSAGFTGNGEIGAGASATAATANSVRFATDAATLTLSGANQIITGGVLVTSTVSTGALITGGTLTTGGGREFVFIDHGKLTVDSQLVNNAGGSTMLTKSGGGTLTLTNAANAHSGINYLTGGVLNIAAAGVLGTSTAANAISFNGGTLQLGASGIDLSGKGINLGYKGGTIDTNGFATTYGGVIASSQAVTGTTSENTGGQFTFTKTGAGTLLLTGTQTYSGATSVTGGELDVDGSLAAASAVTVATGGKLGGNGTVAGKVTAAGTIAPGGTSAAGTLTAGATTLTGTLAIEVNGGSADALQVNGNFDITGATLSVSLLGGGFTAPSYTIAQYTGTLTGTFASVPVGYAVAYNAGIGGNQIVLTQVAGYDTWASGAGLTVLNNGLSDDPDHDGIPNLLEYILGGNPLVSSSAPLPVRSENATNVLLTFKRSDASEGDTTLKAQWSTNLSTWTDIAIGASSSSGVTVTENGSADDDVVVSVPKSNAVGGKLFVRLKATK